MYISNFIFIEKFSNSVFSRIVTEMPFLVSINRPIVIASYMEKRQSRSLTTVIAFLFRFN
jgi:hypothetical protein